MNELSTKSKTNWLLALSSGALYGWGAPKVVTQFVYYWGTGLQISVTETAFTTTAILGTLILVVLFFFSRKTTLLFAIGAVAGYMLPAFLATT